MTFVRNKKEDTKAAEIEWNLGAYERISKEDGDKEESNSISNQTAIIENQIRRMEGQGEKIASVTHFSDDGYAGGSFDRPAYRRMIEWIEDRKINCIIFKDNSRLGRNYPELGRLMEEYFPQMGVRVISILNGIDSYKDPNGYSSAIVSLSNIMNDDYIRQLSIKIKCTFAMKRERGEFLGNYAPYGYMKNPEDNHRLVVDPEAAEVVQMIFNWYAGGMSACGITKKLNALKIPPPSADKTSKGCKGFRSHSSGGVKSNLWSITSVNTMLRDEVYIGNLVQGKFKSASYRTKKMVQADENEWTVIEGTHEPIISDEVFCIVHDRFARHTRVSPQKDAAYLLSGYVRCAYCGRRMNRNVSHGVARYRCPTRAYSPESCQCPSVRESFLEEVILEAIQSQIQELVDAKAVIDTLRAEKSGRRPQNEYIIAMNKAEQEIKRMKDFCFRLYDDLQRGLIDENEYTQFRERYNARIQEQRGYLEKLENSLSELKEARRQDDEFVAFFRKYGNIERLDRETVNHLIDRVEFTDATHIDIYFKFSSQRSQLIAMAETILSNTQETEQSSVC